MRYFLNKLPVFVVSSILIFLSIIVCDVYAVPSQLTIFLVCLETLAVLIQLIHEWYFCAHQIQKIEHQLEQLDEKFLLVELGIEADGYVAHEIQEILRSQERTMVQRIEESEKKRIDYKEYIESWVHDIKTPLTTAEIIAKNNLSTSMDLINTQLRRIHDYVDQALYYARSDSLEHDFMVSEINVGDVVREVLRASARDLIAAGVTPILDDIDQMVRADSKWLAFIIRQILLNAAKYQQEGASARHEIRISAHEFQPSRYSRSVELSIQDFGVGIPAADLARVTDRGFTGSNGRSHGSSTGMGLYLASSLCKKMSLELQVSSKEGKGTTVSIIFPDTRFLI